MRSLSPLLAAFAHALAATGLMAQCPPDLVSLTLPSERGNELAGQAIAFDGQTLAAAAPGASAAGFRRGAVLVWREADSGAWTLEATLRVPGEAQSSSEFASAVACSGDVIAVGAPHDPDSRGNWAGAVYLFHRNPTDNSWSITQRLPNPGPDTAGNFGRALALHADRLLIGPTTTDGPGLPRAVAYYRRTPSGWTIQQVISAAESPAPWASDFGQSLSLSGDRLAIGAPTEKEIVTQTPRGAVFVFERDPESDRFIQQTRLVGPPSTPAPFFGTRFGAAVSLDGDRLAVAASDHTVQGVITGIAYVYELAPADSWVLRASLLPDDRSRPLGFASALALRGQWLAIGAPRIALGTETAWYTGCAFLYQRDGNAAWSARGRRSVLFTNPAGPDSDQAIATSLALSAASTVAPRLALGAPQSLSGRENAGAVHIFSISPDLTDCNGNGLADTCEILAGAARDANGNGVPDRCCPADINGDQLLSVSDIFDFLSAYFARFPIADFNRSGSIGVQDVFDFLVSYFTPCS